MRELERWKLGKLKFQITKFRNWNFEELDFND